MRSRSGRNWPRRRHRPTGARNWTRPRSMPSSVKSGKQGYQVSKGTLWQGLTVSAHQSSMPRVSSHLRCQSWALAETWILLLTAIRRRPSERPDRTSPCAWDIQGPDRDVQGIAGRKWHDSPGWLVEILRPRRWGESGRGRRGHDSCFQCVSAVRGVSSVLLTDYQRGVKNGAGLRSIDSWRISSGIILRT